jgi:hypothetical protein
MDVHDSSTVSGAMSDSAGSVAKNADAKRGHNPRNGPPARDPRVGKTVGGVAGCAVTVGAALF